MVGLELGFGFGFEVGGSWYLSLRTPRGIRMGTGSLSRMGHAGLLVCAIEWLFATDLMSDFGAMTEGRVVLVVKLWRRGLRWLGHKQRGEKHVNFGLEEDNRRGISMSEPTTVKLQGSSGSWSPLWGDEMRGWSG